MLDFVEATKRVLVEQHGAKRLGTGDDWRCEIADGVYRAEVAGKQWRIDITNGKLTWTEEPVTPAS